MIVELSVEDKKTKEQRDPQVTKHFLSSQWYNYIIFVLQHMQAPQIMERTRARLLKKKAARFCILNGKLYWKDRGGVLLNYVNEHDAKKIIE